MYGMGEVRGIENTLQAFIRIWMIARSSLFEGHTSSVCANGITAYINKECILNQS